MPPSTRPGPHQPLTFGISPAGHAEVGGCDLVELAARHGTPLYVYDEATIRAAAREFASAIADAGRVLYGAKAFHNPTLARILAAEGIGMVLVSAGELELALRAGFPPERIHLAGNNKSLEDVDLGIGSGCTLVIDGLHDFELIRQVVPAGRRVRALLRLSPEVRPDTIDLISTGQLDSKFGFSISDGSAAAALDAALAHPGIELAGVHFHIGSQIVDLAAHEAAMAIVLDFLVDARQRHRFTARELDAGGGLGIAHTAVDRAPTPAEFVGRLRTALEMGCAARGLTVPALQLEPGRSLVGRAGISLYTVGSIKVIPGVRTYAAVDGGMADNIRPKLYGATYQSFVAGAPEAEPEARYTIAGRYCESTDILVADAALPRLKTGDVVGLFAAGAYCMSMSSNYNGSLRPEVVMVASGEARVIRRRETIEDLLRPEVF